MNSGGAVKLEDIMGRPVSQDESWDVADYLLACLTHVTNARPLFGIVNVETGVLDWTAGGAEFHDVLGHLFAESNAAHVTSFADLFTSFGIADRDFTDVLETIVRMSPGTSLTVMKPLQGAKNTFYRLVLHRRSEPNAQHVQFSLMDISAFQETAARTRAMAAALAADLDQVVDGQSSARVQLLSVVDDLDHLFELTNDTEIAALAQSMSHRVTAVSQRMVQMLLAFEDRYDTGHWQPRDLNPSLRPVIAVHSAPVNNWYELHGEVLRTVDGVPAIIPEIADQVRHAFGFVKNAASTLLISPAAGRIFALNGPAAEQQFKSIEDFVRAIGVEENSTRTAVEFFSNLSAEPALGLFAVDGANVEAWGRPGHYGGWQAMMLPGVAQGVDVRGLFHGLKNLLLHLQVLYVVDTRADVDQVQNGLAETAAKIKSRLTDLDAIAKTGQRTHQHVQESVSIWVGAAKRVAGEVGKELKVSCDGISQTVYTSIPGEMEDTFEELVRNAYQHGANTVSIGAMGRGDHICLEVLDDGPGMSKDKLIQVQRVLKTRTYDPDLTTREDGTGNGLLAAANAVSQFVDGQLMVDHGPNGQGVKISISMKLPA